MSIVDIIFLLSVFCFGCLFISDWRQGIPLCLWVGFLQDPIRKLVPGQPVFINLLVVIALLITSLFAWQRLKGFSLRELFQNHQGLINLFKIFILLVLLQAINAFVRTNSPLIPILGILSYLLPTFVISLTYYYFQSIRDLERVIFTYILINIGVALSLFLDWLKIKSPLLQPIGEALIVTDSRVGFNLITHNGIMRTSEVAAWHMGAGICATILLFLSGSYRKLRLAALVVVPFFLTAGFLTGRRKFLVMVGTFLVAYLALVILTSLSRGQTRFFKPLFLLLTLLVGGFFLRSTVDLSIFQAYTTRSDVSVNDVQDRFNSLGLASIQWSLDKNNWWGFGAGIASQGSQHLQDKSLESIQGAAEAGLGKVIIELGLPGFVLCGIVVIALCKYLWQTLNLTYEFDAKLAALTTGVLAFQLANFSIFTSAAQIFGDPFVLGIQGFTLGFAFASWKIMRQIYHRRKSEHPI